MDLKEQSRNPHRHPWELSRADMVLDLVGRPPRQTRYADIGSGDLYFARRLAVHTDARIHAVDVHYGAPHVEGRILLWTDVGQVPAGAVDCAFLMDVLEHVDDDVALVREVMRILTPQGRLVVTVPAHAFLWSAHDEFLGHRRRYDRRHLRAVLERGGCEVLECFAFYALPFVWRACSVGLRRLGGGPRPAAVAAWSYADMDPRTRGVRAVLNADFRISRRLGGLLPGWGLSIAALCRPRSA